jgi:hypothetical protein
MRMHSTFKKILSILTGVGILLNASLAHASITIISVTNTGNSSASSVIFGETVDVLLSSTEELDGTI